MKQNTNSGETYPTHIYKLDVSTANQHTKRQVYKNEQAEYVFLQ